MSLLNELSAQLSPNVIKGIGQQIGTNEEQTGQAVSALLPMLIGGLANNSNASGAGMNALNQALERDHDGSVLDTVNQLFGSSQGLGQAAGLLSGMMKGGGGASNMLSGLLGGGNSGAANNLLAGVLGGGDAGSLVAGLLGGNNSRAANANGILNHVLGGRRTAVEQGVGQALNLQPQAISSLLAILAPMVMGALGKAKRQQNLDAQGIASLLNQEKQAIEAQVPDAGGLAGLLDSNNDGKIDLKDNVAKIGLSLGSAMLLNKRR